MEESVREKRVAFVEFTLIYVESGTSLTIGVGGGTGRNDQMECSFSVWKSRLGIWITFQKNPVISEKKMLFGKRKLVFPFTFQPKFSDFLGKW